VASALALGYLPINIPSSGSAPDEFAGLRRSRSPGLSLLDGSSWARNSTWFAVGAVQPYAFNGIVGLPGPSQVIVRGVQLYAAVTGTMLLCAIGSYAASPGLTACLLCASGTYASSVASTVCSVCPSGAYCPMGAVVPIDCPAGTFNSATGQSACVPCPSGYFGTVGFSAAVACAPGKYSPSPGYSSCLSCEAGSYCGAAGMSRPTLCPSGAICPDTGLADPILCPNRTWSALPTACVPCPSDTLCLLGSGTPFSFPHLFGDRTPLVTWQNPNTPLAPIDDLSMSASSQFAILQNNLAYATAAVAAVGLLVGLYVHYFCIVFPDKIVALDLLFRLAHHTPSGKAGHSLQNIVGGGFYLCHIRRDWPRFGIDCGSKRRPLFTRDHTVYRFVAI
jgi:hypothetical protein